MHHGALIFAKRKAGLSAQYQRLSEVWCQRSNITF